MKKIGDFWLPDVDVRWGKQRLKSIRIEKGRGSKLGDLEEALGYLTKWTVAVDGGARVGAYTRILLERFAGIHAFEPAPDTSSALARYGGGEFALLLPATELDGSVQLAEKIRAAIAETEFFIDPPKEREPVTVSIGVSAFQGDRREFFDDADQALYRAKRAGRDCVMVAGVDEEKG